MNSRNQILINFFPSEIPKLLFHIDGNKTALLKIGHCAISSQQTQIAKPGNVLLEEITL